MTVCGGCGHEDIYHHHGGSCQVVLRAGGGQRFDCPCTRYTRMRFGVQVVLRTTVVFMFVAVLATAEGLWGMH